MNAAALRTRIQLGPTTHLLLDTNAVFSDRNALALGTWASQWNLDNPGAAVNIHVSMVAHGEKLFQLKKDKGDRYDPSVPHQALLSKQIGLLEFKEAHALRLASMLGARFPGPEDWLEQKRLHCLRCLHLDDEYAEQRLRLAREAGKKCGKTVDWLIAAQALAEGWVLVTDDKGWEFADVADKIRRAELEIALTGLAQAPTLTLK